MYKSTLVFCLHLAVVSCSSDASIKVWDTETTACIRTLNRHGDYVKALAYAPEANQFVSAGLDSSILCSCYPEAQHSKLI